ncbi:hypothetical protein EVAR_33063_1 [Eumeta japonica]|uniref:Uncharacterized protein n=1 Tax=Eumeta variegata TaxID=151549 RepID=A0A4C1WX00_EUMVA|nr:hypothetical protein EVAR_33063_1 [Eumeta japonica]
MGGLCVDIVCGGAEAMNEPTFRQVMAGNAIVSQNHNETRQQPRGALSRHEPNCEMNGADSNYLSRKSNYGTARRADPDRRYLAHV